MTDSSPNRDKSIFANPTLVAIAGWILPGLGYWLIGQRGRAVVIGVTVIVLFLMGILYAGIRVIDVPGFDRVGNEVRLDRNGRRLESSSADQTAYDNGTWAISVRGLIGELANKPWFVAQFFMGPSCFVASWGSLVASRQGFPVSHARVNDIGTLYTAVAGMLNLLAIIDAASRASASEVSVPQTLPAASVS